MSLHALLDNCAGHDAEYSGSLSNHLPMALLALHELGATPQRLAAFAKGYATRLLPAPALRPWPEGQGWTEPLGRREAWPAYRSLFAQWLVRRGRTGTLEDTLPTLLAGSGGAAFHGLIRTACAWQAGHDAELADGLAYWACRHMPLATAPGGTAPGGDRPAEVLLRELHAGVGSAPRRLKMIADRMRHAAQAPGFAAPVARLTIDTTTLPRLSLLAAMLYARTRNFTVLHLITSCHAMRLLLPALADPLPALRDYWVAYAAGVLASGVDLSQLDAATPTSDRAWSDIIEAAVKSDDEHVIKLVWSCREEQRFSALDGYRLAASSALAA